jgi:hypothetical protein
MMLETLAGIVRRRHYNANLAHDSTPDARVDSIFKDARAALVPPILLHGEESTANRAGNTPSHTRMAALAWGRTSSRVGKGVARIRLLF